MHTSAERGLLAAVVVLWVLLGVCLTVKPNTEIVESSPVSVEFDQYRYLRHDLYVFGNNFGVRIVARRPIVNSRLPDGTVIASCCPFDNDAPGALEYFVESVVFCGPIVDLFTVTPQHVYHNPVGLGSQWLSGDSLRTYADLTFRRASSEADGLCTAYEKLETTLGRKVKP